jgi:hypothetical protein
LTSLEHSHWLQAALTALFGAMLVFLFPWLQDETAIWKLKGSTCEPAHEGLVNVPRVEVEAAIKEYLAHGVGPAGDAQGMRAT